LHPMSGNAQYWHYIAEALVAQGYLVVAPDLLGHGLAPSSTDYSFKAFADALLPLLSSTPSYDLVIGHSLGCLIALLLLPYLSGSLRVVLVDPPLEMKKDVLEVIRMMVNTSWNFNIPNDDGKSLDEMVSEKDLILRMFGRRLCKPSTVEAILDQNSPWSHTHLLPPPSPTLELIILGADPSVWAVFTPEEADRLKNTHPHIKTVMVKGASHGMVGEVLYRDVIVRAAIGNA